MGSQADAVVSQLAGMAPAINGAAALFGGLNFGPAVAMLGVGTGGGAVITVPALQTAQYAQAVARVASTATATGAVANGISSRPFINSSLTIQEIMMSVPPIPDPQGVPGVWRWNALGAFNGSAGQYQLNISAFTNEIYHFLFTGRPR